MVPAGMVPLSAAIKAADAQLRATDDRGRLARAQVAALAAAAPSRN